MLNLQVPIKAWWPMQSPGQSLALTMKPETDLAMNALGVEGGGRGSGCHQLPGSPINVLFPTPTLPMQPLPLITPSYQPSQWLSWHPCMVEGQNTTHTERNVCGRKQGFPLSFSPSEVQQSWGAPLCIQILLRRCLQYCLQAV